MRETYELQIKAPTRLLRGQNGYTLIEIIMVIVILGVIGGFTFQMVGAGVQAFKKSSARKDLYDQGRLALERVVRELRDGKEITDCSSDSITFKKAHPAQAADNVEEVKFELVGTELKRVGDPNGNEGGPYEAVLASDVTSFSVGSEGGAGVNVDSVSSGTTAAYTDSTMTVAHTTGSGSDRLMLVGISFNPNDNERVTTVTYGGTSLTKVGEGVNGNDAMVYIYSLVAPAPGAADVVITFDSALDEGAIAGVMTFTGVEQTTPLGTFASASGNNSTPASVNITSASGELVFGVVSSEYEAFTASSGQNEHWNMSISGAATNGAGGTDAGAPTVAMSWSLDPSYNHWASGGVSIKPSGSTGSTVCSAGAGAVTLDNVTSRYNAGTGNLAHTISSGSGNNRLLVVCYGQENDNTITSMTYNGVNMTKIHRESHYSGSYNVTEMWYMLDADMPSSAGTYDISMSVTAGNGPGIVVLSFEGVAQQAPETHNASHYDDWANDRSITQISNVSAGSLVVSVASNGSSGGYDGSVGGAGGAGIRQAEGEPASAAMGVSTDLSSAGGTFNVTEISDTGSTTRRATHIVSAFAHASSLASNPLVPLAITLQDPNDSSNSLSMRTKVYMRNVPETGS
jgi:prepilin-type N-terminal cleavage/methylation domain-containing protein